MNQLPGADKSLSGPSLQIGAKRSSSATSPAALAKTLDAARRARRSGEGIRFIAEVNGRAAVLRHLVHQSAALFIEDKEQTPPVRRVIPADQKTSSSQSITGPAGVGWTHPQVRCRGASTVRPERGDEDQHA